MHHEAYHHQVVLVVIDEAAAAGVLAQRPAHGVDHPALLESSGRTSQISFMPRPYFCGSWPSDSFQPLDDLLGQRSAHALADEDILAVQFHAGLIVRSRRAVQLQPHLARNDATHAVALPDDLRCGHAGEDLDAQFLGLFGQPAGKRCPC